MTPVSIHTNSCCSRSPYAALSTPHLLISIPTILSGCSSFTALKCVINVRATRTEISFLWLHVCVNQMWSICSDASPQDEYQPRAGFIGPLLDENLELPGFCKADTFQAAFD